MGPECSRYCERRTKANHLEDCIHIARGHERCSGSTQRAYGRELPAADAEADHSPNRQGPNVGSPQVADVDSGEPRHT